MAILILGPENGFVKWLRPDIDSKKPTKGRNDLQLKRVKIYSVEIEWLEQNLTYFMQMITSDELCFDNWLVKELLHSISHLWSPIFFFIFTPFMLNFGFLTYYFCFILSDPYEPRTGFFHGSKFAIALRCLIIIFTSYFIILEVVSIFAIVGSAYEARRAGEKTKHIY